MKLVISAVNFTEGGPLTILREAVRTAAQRFPDWTIIVLVHASGTVDAPGAIELPYPASKRSWLRRLWLEWVEFDRLSRQLQPDVWLSLHDITPRVQAQRQYVYCHNPAPFCTTRIAGQRHDPKFLMFRQFYGALYRCFIHRNAAVIVQQDWLRRLFMDRYHVPRVIVAHPSVAAPQAPASGRRDAPTRFLYPAFPRVFKNFEVLGECALLLDAQPDWHGEIIVTIHGSENRYAQAIRRRYGACRSLRFVGLQPPQQMATLYRQADALLFASVLETWGLPLTEAKAHGLPIVAADLPYARETIGTYGSVRFFDPTDAPALARLLLQLHRGQQGFEAAQAAEPAAPFVSGWEALLDLLLVGDAPVPRQPAVPAQTPAPVSG